MNGNEKKARVGVANLERRKYPRFTIDLPFDYYPIDSGARCGGRTLNASEGGLLVYLPERMEIGQRLSVKLFFSSDSKLNAVEMLTEVVWLDINLGGEWGDYRSGLRIIDISEEDFSRLLTFLKSLSR